MISHWFQACSVVLRDLCNVRSDPPPSPDRPLLARHSCCNITDGAALDTLVTILRCLYFLIPSPFLPSSTLSSPWHPSAFSFLLKRAEKRMNHKLVNCHKGNTPVWSKQHFNHYGQEMSHHPRPPSDLHLSDFI